jgi:hypothetical protein
VFVHFKQIGVVASAPRIPRRFNTGASLANPFAWNGRVDPPGLFFDLTLSPQSRQRLSQPFEISARPTYGSLFVGHLTIIRTMFALVFSGTFESFTG